MGTKNSATVKADKAKVDKAIIILFNQCIQLERAVLRSCK